MDEKKNHTKDISPSCDQEHIKKKDAAGDEAAKKKPVTHKKMPDRIHQLEAQIASLQMECDELKDKYLRTLAEMDNFRKRVAKEKEEFQKYALSDFLLSLLQVLDNLERALSARNAGNDQAVISGVEITVKQFMDILKSFEVREIEALGKAFNPAVHEALVREEREGISEPMVVEVFQKGFMLKDRLLRPALTKVAAAAEPKNREPEPIPPGDTQ